MIIKHPFKVNQVWKSNEYPERDFIIYQTDEYDCETAYDSNLWSYIFTAKVNEKAFKDKVAKTFKVDKYENIKRESIFPFSWFSEYKVNSLKQYIKKYNMYMTNEENYRVVTYGNDGDLTIINSIEDTIDYDELYKKYSK